MSSDESDDKDLTDEEFARIEELCDEFLARLRSGQTHSSNDFVVENPHLAPHLENRLRVIEAVFRISDSSGFGPTSESDETGETVDLSRSRAGLSNDRGQFLSDQATRIGCPHCGNIVQLVHRAKATQTCASCGSNVTVDTQDDSFELQQLPALIGRFQIIQLLGEGAFGAVYLAFDPQLRRQVAVKSPRTGYFQSSSEKQRFLREAQNVAKLNHPNIVPVYEVSQDSTTPYIVSKFVDGLTLGDLASNGLLTFKEMAKLMSQICDAVNYAHENGVIHRDLKPGNILVDFEKRAYVADFGLARRDDAEITMTVDGMILGTPAYMPPEQAAGLHEKVDARSDVYALGVVLYKLLAKELPFSGTRRMLLEQVIHEEPRSPRRLNDNIPRDLETITMKALSKSPDARFQTAGQFGDELRRWLMGEPIVSRPVGSLARFGKWCRRNPLVATLSASIATLLLAGFIVAWIVAVQANQRREESDSRLHQIYQQNATLALDNNQLIEAGHWYAKCLEVRDSPRDSERIGLLLNRIPNLKGVYPTDSRVQTLAIDKDSRKMAIGTKNGTVQVVNLVTREVIFESKTENSLPVFEMEFLSSGSSLVFRSGSKDFQIWDIENNRLIKQLPHAAVAPFLAVNEQRTLLATASTDGVIKVINAQGGALLGELKAANQIREIKFIPNSNSLLILDWRETDTEGQAIATYTSRDLGSGDVNWKKDRPFPPTAEFSLEGNRIFVTSVKQSIKRVEDRGSWLPDEYSLEVWDAASGEPVGKTIKTDGSISPKLISGDKSAVSIIVDKNALQRWDYQTGEPIGLPNTFNFEPYSAAQSGNGKVIACPDDDGSIRFLDRSGLSEVVSRIPSHLPLPKMRFNRTGECIAVESEGVVQVWELPAGLPDHFTFRHKGGVTDCLFSPDGSKCFTTGVDGIATIWSCRTGGQIGSHMGHKAEISECAVSSDGQLFATASFDKQAMVWDAASGDPVGKFLPHESPVSHIAFAPDNKKLVTSCDDGTIHCWKVSANKSEELKPLFSMKHDQYLSHIAFDSVGSLIATSSYDGTFRIWDAETGVAKYGPFEHSNSVVHIAISPDDRMIASSGTDNTIKIWDFRQSKLLQTLAVEGLAKHLLFLSDTRLVANDYSGRTTTWERKDNKFQSQHRFKHHLMLNHYYSDVDSAKNRIAVAGGLGIDHPGEVMIWGLKDKKLVAPPFHHGNEIPTVRFSPTDDQFISFSVDGPAQLWQLKTTQSAHDSALVFELLHKLTKAVDASSSQSNSIAKANAMLNKQSELFESSDLKLRIWQERFGPQEPSADQNSR